MKPNIKKYNPCPIYIKSIIAKSGCNVAQISKLSGVPASTIHTQLSDKYKAKVSYPLQYFIESL